MPPHSRPAERAVIGACLLAPYLIDEVAEHVEVADFYVPFHGQVWETILRTQRSCEAVDVITVADRFTGMRPEELLTDLVTLQTEVASTGTAPTHAKRIAELALRRRVIAYATTVTEMAYGDETATDALLDWATRQAAGLDTRPGTNEPVIYGDVLRDWAERERALTAAGNRPTGIPTGLTELDTILLGLHPGQLIVLAARPGMGKTLVGIQWAIHAARQAHTSLFVSVEMGIEELSQRMVSSQSKVDLQRIRSRLFREGDWPRIKTMFADSNDIPFWTFDEPNATANAIRSKASRIPGLELIVVDYMQLITASPVTKDRQQDVSSISRSLKILARDLNVSIVALAQLSRALESRSDRRPILSDLRESGSIEQDGDVVIGLYRDEMYDPDSPDEGVAELIILKHRNGSRGTIRAAYLSEYGRFENLAR